MRFRKTDEMMKDKNQNKFAPTMRRLFFPSTVKDMRCCAITTFRPPPPAVPYQVPDPKPTNGPDF